MRWWIVFLALVGVAVASLALREHYRVGTSPCSINDRWDCGTVNQSPYAVLVRIPVAVIGIGGYVLLGLLAAIKAIKALLFFTALAGLAFSLYLTRLRLTFSRSGAFIVLPRWHDYADHDFKRHNPCHETSPKAESLRCRQCVVEFVKVFAAFFDFYIHFSGDTR